MKKINQKELKSLINLVLAEADKLSIEYNKQLPSTDAYLEKTKEIENSEFYTFNLGVEEELKTFKSKLIDRNKPEDHLKIRMLTSYIGEINLMLGNYKSDTLRRSFPEKKIYGSKNSWSGDNYRLGESMIILANSDTDEKNRLPYLDIRHYRDELIKMLFEAA